MDPCKTPVKTGESRNVKKSIKVKIEPRPKPHKPLFKNMPTTPLSSFALREARAVKAGGGQTLFTDFEILALPRFVFKKVGLGGEIQKGLLEGWNDNPFED